MKKLLTVIISLMLAATCAVGFAGCTDPFNNDEYGKDDVDGKVTIKVAVLSSDSEKGLMASLKKAFEAQNSLINIKIEPLRSDFNATMLDYIKTPSTFPDLIWVPGEYHSPFSSAGHFLNLRSYYENDPDINLDDYYESIMDMTKHSPDDTGIWFAPRDYNKPVVFINKDMFRLAGIEIPGDNWTLDDMLDICKTLREKMNDTSNTSEEKIAGLIPASYPLDADFNWNPSYLSWIAHYGGKLVDTSKTGVDAIAIDSTRSKEAYKKIYGNVVRRKYAPSSDSNNLFPRKKSAMWITVRPELPACVNLGLNVDFLPLPLNNVAVGCSGYGISKVAENRVDTSVEGNTKSNAELAWEFIKFIISEQGQNVMGSFGSGIPVLKSLTESGTWLNYYDENANHGAFVSFPDKDMSQLDHYVWPAENHLTIKKQFDGVANAMTSTITWDGSPLGGTPGDNPIGNPSGNYKTLEEALAKIRAELVKLAG